MRRELGSLASNSGVDMILLVRRWSISSYFIDLPDSEPVYVPGADGKPMMISSRSSGGSQEVCVVMLEGGIFDSRGEMLFYGKTSGNDSVFLFFYKSALRSAVADAAEKYAEMMTGVWPDEQLRKPALDLRRRDAP
jgi:hypothetical protein